MKIDIAFRSLLFLDQLFRGLQYPFPELDLVPVSLA